MDVNLRKLLLEQSFSGKRVSLFSSDPEVSGLIGKRMAAEVSEGALIQSDFVIYWLWQGAEKKSVVKSAFDSLGSKGKLVFLLPGKEHADLKAWLWDVGFLTTRYFVAKVTPTSGASYEKGGKKAEFLFVVAEKLNFS